MPHKLKIEPRKYNTFLKNRAEELKQLGAKAFDRILEN